MVTLNVRDGQVRRGHAAIAYGNLAVELMGRKTGAPHFPARAAVTNWMLSCMTASRAGEQCSMSNDQRELLRDISPSPFRRHAPGRRNSYSTWHMKRGHLTSALLRVARKQDMVVTLQTCAWTTDYELDFSGRRSIARQELQRRGIRV